MRVQYSRDELGVMAPVWTADSASTVCMICGLTFGWILPRRHHCRACGAVTTTSHCVALHIAL